MVTALAGLLLAGTSCRAAAPPFSAFFGMWKVGKVAGAASVTESQQSADAAIGTFVRISADLIQSYSRDDACKPRHATVTDVDTEKTLETEFSTRLADLHLPKAKMASRMAYLDAGCAFALMIDHETLLWPMGNGYIYLVTRQSR